MKVTRFNLLYGGVVLFGSLNSSFIDPKPYRYFLHSIKKFLTMLRRYVRASHFAARFFSIEAAAAAAKAVTTNKSSAKSGGGGGVGRETLGWRLIGLVYPKRSAVVTIRKWLEEGHTVRKYELNRIVRELRKLKRYKHALEVSFLLSY